jgi:hypothetical protein
MIREVTTVIKKKKSKKQVSDACEVMLECDRGTVGRRRHGKDNVYICEDEEISASGRDVPVEVTNILGLQDINVQSQHDDVYLLSATAGEVSRTLNKVADLEKIDVALRSADMYVRKQKKELDTVLKAIEKDTERLQRYEGLDEVGEDLEALGGLNKKIQEKSRYCDELVSLLDRYDAAIEAKENTPDLSVLLPKIEKVEGYKRKATELKREKTSVERLLDKYKKSERNVELMELQLEKSEKEFQKLFPAICPLCGAKKGE